MKKMRQKGALFVEYALLLAFVLITGVAFVNRNEFPDSVKSIFVKAEQILGLAAGEGPGENQGGGNNNGGNGPGENPGNTGGKEDNKEDNNDNGNNDAVYSFEGYRDGIYWGDSHEENYTSNKDRWFSAGFSTEKLVALDPGEYDITFDRNKFAEIVGKGSALGILDKRDFDDVVPYLMGYTMNGEQITGHVLDSKHNNVGTVGADNLNKYTLVDKGYNNNVYTFSVKNTGETINLGVNFAKGTSHNFDKVSAETMKNAINQSLTITKKQ